MKTAKCRCKTNECVLKFSEDEYIPCRCPMGLVDDENRCVSSWYVVGSEPHVLSTADKIYIMASAHVMESCAFATAYDGEDQVGGAVTDLESLLKTMCTDHEVFDKVDDIFDALESVKKKFPDWESEGDCHAFVNVIDGECDDIKRMLKSPGSSPEDLARRMGV